MSSSLSALSRLVIQLELQLEDAISHTASLAQQHLQNLIQDLLKGHARPSPHKAQPILWPASGAYGLQDSFQEVCIGLIYILFVFQDTA